MQDFLLTSESVTEGHPDKLCDQISDGILDAYLSRDPMSRVAVETMASANTLFIAGEITSDARVDIVSTARKIARDIGFRSDEAGLDADNCLILTNIHAQSPDIWQGVGLDGDNVGAGDQGIMYGFACNESETLMPLTHYLATKLSMRLAEQRENGQLAFLLPDGKSQVTVRYSGDGKPDCVTSVIVSAHHKDGISMDFIREAILYEVIYPVIDRRWLRHGTVIHINPTGSFSIGGPAADTGLTGRKLMVDTYGGIGKHGGGAFSGKDPTKVDRSGAYMARYTAKQIVAAGLAERCEVSLAYAIGLPKPEAVTINTFGTGKIPEEELREIAADVFSYSVRDILEHLALRRPQYLKTASYGHFGRENLGFRWEETDMVSVLREKAIDNIKKKWNGQ